MAGTNGAKAMAGTNAPKICSIQSNFQAQRRRSVARTLGKVDMYRDFAKTENQQGLEKQLADLESLAGRVVAAIRKRFEAGNEDVWITRLERDTLRKFLFIMKYRSSNMHQRFCPETFEDYSTDDREEMLEYVRGKDFKKPIDVWFDNIKAMLELEMDPSGKWTEEIRRRAYPPDAEWFVHHTQGMFMALCTPSEKEDEFLLTENGYGIHEGPVSGLVDPSTGQFTATSYNRVPRLCYRLSEVNDCATQLYLA